VATRDMAGLQGGHDARTSLTPGAQSVRLERVGPEACPGRESRSIRDSSRATSPWAREWVQVLLFGGWWDDSCDDETWLATGVYSGIWYRTYLPLVVRNH
jgi:hypothetical protein